MVDLSGSGEREIEFGRQVEVQVEIFFWSLRLSVCGGEIGEGGGGRHH